MALRLRIIPNAILPFQQAYAVRQDIIRIAWLPLMLIMMIEAIRFIPFSPEDLLPRLLQFTFQAGDAIHTFSLGPYVFNILIAILFSIPSVALLRFVLLGEKPVMRNFTVKRGGVDEDKVMLSIPYYFSFGKRERAYAALTLGVAITFLLLNDLAQIVRVMQLANDHAREISPHDPLVYIRIFLGFSERLVFAAAIIAWPLIAISDRWAALSAANILKPVRGNIIRILVIGYLIFLPYEIIMHMAPAVEWLFLLAGEDAYRASYGFFIFQWHVFVTIGSIVWYMCSFVDLFFTTNVYKNLSQK